MKKQRSFPPKMGHQYIENCASSGEMDLNLESASEKYCELTKL